MNDWLLILITIVAVLIAVGIFAALIIWKRKEEVKLEETDYRAIFIMGISFISLGAILTITVSAGFTGITVLGILFMLFGLANQDKWKK